MFQHILLATDGSPASDKAARLAVSLAREQHARLTAVYVVDPYPFLGISDTNPLGMPAYLAAAQRHAAEAHARVEALCEQGDPEVPLELLLVEDAAAAKGILQTASDQGADLIVLGSHGRSGWPQLLGGVVSKLASVSPVPVLIAR